MSRRFNDIVISQKKENAGKEVIKPFMLNSTDHEFYHGHKC